MTLVPFRAGTPGSLDTARQALAEADTLPEITGLIDRAEVVRVAARKAQLSLDAQNDWAEYKLDAERKAGRVLAEMDKAKAAPGNQYTGPVDRSNDATGPPRLADLGISRDQSSRWQRLAALPDDEYEGYKTTTRAAGGEVTEAGALRRARQVEDQAAAATFDEIGDQLDDGSIANARLRATWSRTLNGLTNLNFLDPEAIAAVIADDPGERANAIRTANDHRAWLARLERALRGFTLVQGGQE